MDEVCQEMGIALFVLWSKWAKKRHNFLKKCFTVFPKGLISKSSSMTVFIFSLFWCTCVFGLWDSYILFLKALLYYMIYFVICTCILAVTQLHFNQSTEETLHEMNTTTNNNCNLYILSHLFLTGASYKNL